MRPAFMALTLIVVVTLLLAGTGSLRPAPAAGPSAHPPPAPVDHSRPLYDPDAEHLWNQIDRHLRWRRASDSRVHGAESLDPLLWRETRYLLEGESHTRAVELLDRFLATGGERLVSDPLKRLLFQRDLWAVFDWTVSTFHANDRNRHALASRLARIIRRIAPSEQEADRIRMAFDWERREQPFDTYAAAVAAGRFPSTYDPSDHTRPFLPVGMFDPNGPWVPIHGSTPVAKHADEMSRSDFGVFLAIPGGRQATLEYLRRLWESPSPFTVEPIQGELRTALDPGLRPMPIGAQIALVRRMLFIDAAGEIRYSNVVESIQIRVFREPTAAPRDLNRFVSHDDQNFFEFVLERHGLLTSMPMALRAVTPTDAAFLTFSTHGTDAFERLESPRPGRTLEMCVACHSQEGLDSVMTRARLFKPYPFATGKRPVLDGNAAFWKSRRADWGRLQTYWQMEPH